MAESTKQIDPAALAVAALAGILALSTKEGQYDLLGLMTSVTLVLVLIAYSGESRKRSTLQSLAFGVVIGLCATEGFGTILEWSAKYGILTLEPTPPLPLNWDECRRQLQLPAGVKLTATCNAGSKVPTTCVRIIGIFCSLAWFSYDMYQKSKSVQVEDDIG